MSTFVKICGVTRPADALRAFELGADAIGVNLVPTSKRRVSEEQAAAIVRAVRGRGAVFAVVADCSETALRGLVTRLGVDRLQLHGDEPPELVTALAPVAFKALRLRGAEAFDLAMRFPGEPLLIDAHVEGALGGTGQQADWELAAHLAMRRQILLAGGLRPDNVAEAVAHVRPWGVDVASGVEPTGRPGEKDWHAVRAFIERAQAA